jgi:hypothetical protein
MPIKIVKETNLDIVENESSTDHESVSPPLPEEKTVEEQSKKRVQVDFLASIESKALVEAIAPLVEDFKIESIMKVVPKIIKHVQKYKSLSGLEKKTMIVSMLSHIVDITDGPGDDDLWDPIIKRLIPSVIDTIVLVDKGKLKLNTKKSGLLKLVSKLFSCCRSSKCCC